MPPSPSPRRHPVELRVESSRKDDDLVLFSEMQSVEKENFLLHTSDDFDESISKLRYFSDFNLGINIPAQGESSDLLNVDGDKNDYDWLLTPPDTPLFPSLDDDKPQSVNASRGRTRSQPISISRTSMHEKTPRTNRSSASPHRLSPSPRSSYSIAHSRTRSSSAPGSSSPPAVRATTPLRRPSPPPTKPSPPAQRSLTPTLRRMSTGSSGQSFAGKRGTSPMKTNRGNSASPKFRGWQSNIPGFSTDVPPNLRTSLTDRSALRARGFSPPSGSGRGSMPKFGRQSISPSSSRSPLSSQNSADHFSSIISKASAASSCDDDAESHVSVGVSPDAVTRKYRDFANSRAMGFSKRASRSPSASSAPKRSFDLAVRQMDHRKAPPNMFRPLLSSVPATSFYTGKSNSVHQPMFSRNSSLTTSSNASSELGTSLAPDLEDSGHEQSDLAGECEKPKAHEFQEEVFFLDEIREDASHDTCTAKCQSGIENFGESMNTNTASVLEYLTGEDGGTVNVAVDSSCATEVTRTDYVEKMSTCSKCGKYFIAMILDVHVCQECSRPYQLVSSEEPGSIRAATQEIISAENRTCLKCGKNLMVVDMDLDVCRECSAKYAFLAHDESRTVQVVTLDDGNDKQELQSQMRTTALCERKSEVVSRQHEPSSKQGATDYSIDTGVYLSPTDKVEGHLLKHEVFRPDELNTMESSGTCESPQSQAIPNLNHKADNSEGTGIAVLLMHGSSSRKWPVMRGKGISAANILLAEPSHGGDSMNVMKRSLGRDSSSTSSSIDLGTTGQTDSRILHHISRKAEMENVRGESQADISAMKHSHGGSGSASTSIDLGSSGQTDGSILHHVSSRKSERENTRGEHHSCSHSDSENIVATETRIGSKEFSSCVAIAHGDDAIEKIRLDDEKPANPYGDAESRSLDHTLKEQAVIGMDVCSLGGASLASSGSLLQLAQGNCLQMNGTSITNDPNNLVEACDSCGNNGEVFLHKNEMSMHEIESPTTIEDGSILDDNCMPSSRGSEDDFSDIETHSSSLVISDKHNGNVGCQDALVDNTHAHMPNCVEDFQEACGSITSDKDVLFSELELKNADDPSFEEPAKTIESPKKRMQRSFTMEEATDTILFCRSIVQDIAYKAATIAANKELALYESSHSRVAFVGSTVSNQKDLRKTPNRLVQSPRKVKRKKPETTEEIPPVEPASDLNNLELAEVSRTDSSVKLPKSESKCSCIVM